MNITFGIKVFFFFLFFFQFNGCVNSILTGTKRNQVFHRPCNFTVLVLDRVDTVQTQEQVFDEVRERKVKKEVKKKKK